MNKWQEGETRLVLYPCPKHLPRGAGYVMGDALGDMFWEHPDGGREQIASCRMCRDEQPPVVVANPFTIRNKVRYRHYPAHRKPSA